ncbi:MAG TPA: SDR family oxidoreductase [Chloroflexota bacterium]|nr:SDR family oxidoreductase [Chloroflexota bacterium]
MDLGLRGKTALVAAASKGLGKGVALALAREGATVVMFSRDKAGIEDAANDVATAVTDNAGVIGLAADVTVLADLERVVNLAIERFHSVDVLFNNAGGPKPGMFDSLTDDDWQHAFELNLMSAVRLTRLCLPHMRTKRWGRIITSTSSSVKQPLPTLMLSNAVRSATTAWSKTLADQVAQDGITVNCLAPGRIATERIRQIDTDVAERQGRSLDDVTRDSLANIPLHRYGDPAEFGVAAAFLASEPAAYITGVTLLVDGGQFRGTY